MSKGSRPRPIEVERKVFEDNWDRIFNKMWSHYCKQEKGVIYTGRGEECNWCGLTEEKAKEEA